MQLLKRQDMRRRSSGPIASRRKTARVPASQAASTPHGRDLRKDAGHDTAATYRALVETILRGLASSRRSRAAVEAVMASRLSAPASADVESASGISMPAGHRQYAETPSKQAPRCHETAPARP